MSLNVKYILLLSTYFLSSIPHTEDYFTSELASLHIRVKVYKAVLSQLSPMLINNFYSQALLRSLPYF